MFQNSLPDVMSLSKNVTTLLSFQYMRVKDPLFKVLENPLANDFAAFRFSLCVLGKCAVLPRCIAMSLVPHIVLWSYVVDNICGSFIPQGGRQFVGAGFLFVGPTRHFIVAFLKWSIGNYLCQHTILCGVNKVMGE